LLGLTSGAIRLDSYQEQLVSGTTSKVYFENKGICGDYNEESEAEVSCNNENGNLPESEEDNEHEDCSDADGYETSETENDGIEIVHDIGNVPNDKEVENVDWERLYSTGEFALKGSTNRNAVTDAPEQAAGEAYVKESMAWKKRLVIFELMFHFVTYLLRH
jgi:hypothetical protein